MAKRNIDRQRLALKFDSLNESEVKELLDYISIMESMRQAKNLPQLWEDELVSLLSESTENKRARQTFEWESIRRRSDRRHPQMVNHTRR